jgi:hypothetical protein
MSPLTETQRPRASPSIRRSSPKAGKSPLECDCVVGLRGLELRAKHAVLSNRSLSLPQLLQAGISPGREGSPLAANPNLRSAAVVRRAVRLCHCAVKCRSIGPANHPVGTGVWPPLERYCWSISGAKGAPRSCPAGSIAEVGLRWCGATPRNRTEDLDVKVFEEATGGVSASGRSNRQIIATHCGRCCAQQG